MIAASVRLREPGIESAFENQKSWTPLQEILHPDFRATSLNSRNCRRDNRISVCIFIEILSVLIIKTYVIENIIRKFYGKDIVNFYMG